jgi:hypothetical protein
MMKVKRKQSSQGLTTNSGLCVVLGVSVVRLGRAREVSAGKMLTGIVSMHTICGQLIPDEMIQRASARVDLENLAYCDRRKSLEMGNFFSFRFHSASFTSLLPEQIAIFRIRNWPFRDFCTQFQHAIDAI